MEPGFRTYVAKRIGFAVLMLVGVSIILFTIMRLAPGGPEAVLVGGEFSQEAAAPIRQRLGPDRPLVLRLGKDHQPGVRVHVDEPGADHAAASVDDAPGLDACRVTPQDAD